MRAAFTTGGRDASDPPALERESALGRVRHGALLLGHNALARGRCLGLAHAGDAVDPSRDLVHGAFDWEAAAEMSPPAVVVWMHPSKDPTQTKPRYPILVQRRNEVHADSRLGEDPMCTYDALLAVRALQPGALHTDLFFRVPPPAEGSSHWTNVDTGLISRWVKEVCPAAGLPTEGRGSSSLRIGGATDLYDLYGPQAERLIRERGRWASDVAQIYQRVSATAHGAASRAIGDSEGVDLQSMLGGWAQLAVSHGRCGL